jgi:hypothetical protein
MHWLRIPPTKIVAVAHSMRKIPARSNANSLKAEVLLNLMKPDDARQVVESTLAQIQLDPSTESRNQRLVARLRDLESTARNVSKN